MGLNLITEPDVEPVTLEQLKAHLKITWDNEDEVLGIYLKSAREWVENYTHRALISQTWDRTMSDFPAGRGLFELPLGKCSAVVRIQYYDVNGTLQTLSGPTSSPSAASYQEDLSSKEGAIVAPPINGDWPSVQTDRLVPVTVRFTVGYASPESVPESLRLAVLYRADDYYAFRGSEDEGPGAKMSKDRCSEYRILRHAA